MQTIDHTCYDRTVRDLRKLRVSEDLGLVNAHEAMFLLCLRDGGGMPMNLAAAVVGISRAAMTSMADRLATAGLIARDPSPSDRRVTHVALTVSGTLRVDEALEAELVTEENA